MISYFLWITLGPHLGPDHLQLTSLNLDTESVLIPNKKLKANWKFQFFIYVPKHFSYPNWVKSIAHDPALDVNYVNPNFLKWKHGRWGSHYVKSKFHKKNNNFICKYLGKHGSQIPSASILLLILADLIRKLLPWFCKLTWSFFCIFISPSTCKNFRNKWINEKSDWSVRRKSFFVCVLILNELMYLVFRKRISKL